MPIKLNCDCGNSFSVNFQPDIRSKSFRCPQCKTLKQFTEYEILDDGCSDSHIGSIVFGEKTYVLNEGHNIIGRESSNHIASIELPNRQKRTSRKHIDICVSRIPMRGYVHRLSLIAERINETKVNSLSLHKGDIVLLNHGDKIFLPDHELKFINPTLR